MPIKKQNGKSAALPPEKYFWCCDGQIFKSIKELSGGLAKMPESTFKYHANEQKNDFSRWIEDVFNKKTLASLVKKSKTARAAAKTIKEKM
ncbi:MAG: hypothetical protein M1127_01410 [Patescibacteria group bacterium]|nr:hypothetical protein [Patescibacteria group bacterium]